MVGNEFDDREAHSFAPVSGLSLLTPHEYDAAQGVYWARFVRAVHDDDLDPFAVALNHALDVVSVLLIERAECAAAELRLADTMRQLDATVAEIKADRAREAGDR